MASERDRFRSASSSAPKEEDSPHGATNLFKNDGSFLEMFKKSQRTGIPVPGTSFKKEAPAAAATPQPKPSEEGEIGDSAEKKPKEIPKPKYGFVGKRRGGKILPTGKVKKLKKDDEDEDTGKKDAWSQYLSEVKKYKNQSCQEEGATRPLVK